LLPVQFVREVDVLEVRDRVKLGVRRVLIRMVIAGIHPPQRSIGWIELEFVERERTEHIVEVGIQIHLGIYGF